MNCVLALKSYGEWKQTGGIGAWKYGGNLKTAGSGNYFIRKNSELFINSFSRNPCSNGKVNNDQNFSSAFIDEPIDMVRLFFNSMNSNQILLNIVRLFDVYADRASLSEYAC